MRPRDLVIAFCLFGIVAIGFMYYQSRIVPEYERITKSLGDDPRNLRMTADQAKKIAHAWVKQSIADPEASLHEVTGPRSVMGKDYVVMRVRQRNLVGGWIFAHYVARVNTKDFERIWPLSEFIGIVADERKSLRKDDTDTRMALDAGMKNLLTPDLEEMWWKVALNP